MCVSNMKFCVDYDLLVSLMLNCPSVLRFLGVISVVLSVQIHQGRIQDFKLAGAHLKKLRRAEGGAKIVGVFRVKNHDFTPKNHIFPILGGAREIFGVFHVKNHDFTPKKKSYFYQF